MPLIVTSAFNVEPPPQVWIREFDGVSPPSDDRSKSLNIDGNGDILMVGELDSNDNVGVIKYSGTTGSILWQRNISDTGGTRAFLANHRSIVSDSSNNVIVGVRDVDSSVACILKYNSSGTLQWQRQIDSPWPSAQAETLSVDGSDNIIIGHRTSASLSPTTTKLTSAGAVSWSRSYSGLGSSNMVAVVADTSTDDVYTLATGSSNMVLSKLNSAGTEQWQRVFGDGDNQGQAAHVDSSGNIIIIGAGNSQVATSIAIAKYNSSGTIQWQRNWDVSSNEGISVATDSSDNVYVSRPSNDVRFVKYNSAGTEQWQRVLSQTSNLGSSEIISDGTYLYQFGNSLDGTNDHWLLTRFPVDGGGVGSYADSYAYAVSSDAEVAGTATDAVSSVTVNSESPSTSASSLTDAAGTMTETVIE